MRRPGSSPTVWAGLLLALAASCGSEGDRDVVHAAESRANQPRYNLLVITVDTLRRDHLSCYGYFRKTSPNLDALAAQSLLFEDFQANAAQTLPSHTSLFTGLGPREHGIEANMNALGGSYVPAENIALLAEVLGEQGYTTAGFVSATPLKAGAGLEAGFQTWVEPGDGVRCVRGDVTLEAALDWLDEAPEEPWFIWFHIFDPHHPYLAPEKHRRFGGEEEQLAYFEARDIPTESSPRPPRVIDVRALHDQYDAEVHFSDAIVGKLLGRVAGMGSWPKTAVVVASDHGEGLWQHGERDHSSIWSEQLSIPLILRVPGVPARRVKARMLGSDLVPTLFGLLPGLQGGRLLDQSSGSDVLEPGYEAPPRYTVVPVMPALRGMEGLPPRFVHALEHAGWRVVVRDDGSAQLFDLDTDPYELVDLAGAEPDRLRRMLELLERRYASELDRARALGAGELGPLNPARLEALEALGYGGAQR